MDKVDRSWTPRGQRTGSLDNPARPHAIRSWRLRLECPSCAGARAVRMASRTLDCPSFPSPGVQVPSIPTAAAEDDSADRAQQFWEAEHTPLPQTSDRSSVDARKASRDTSESAGQPA